MKFKRAIPLLLAAVMIVGSLSGCGNNGGPQYIGEVTDESFTQEPYSDEQSVAETMPRYDYKTLPTADKISGKEFPTSYYARLLPERNKIVFDEIYAGAKDFQDEVVLSKQPSPKELEKIMNIIYLDTAELYMLDTTYGYDTDSNGYVYKVYLTYIMDKERYEDIEKNVVSTMSYTLSDFINSQDTYEAENKILAAVEDKYTSEIRNEEFPQDAYKSSILPLFLGLKGNHISVAKLFSYYCRMTGIDCAVVVGELTSTDFAHSIGLEIPEYKEPAEAIKQTISDSHVIVECDYTSFYAWNIVKINDAWYHVDPIMTPLMKNSQSFMEYIDNNKLRLLENVPDYTISQSRLFYVNEDVLGLIPECKSVTFQSFYRSGDYFLNYTEAQNTVATMNFLDKMIQEKPARKVLQFQTEEGYNIFMKNIERLITTYNNNNSHPIRSHAIYGNRETLSVIIYNLVYIDKQSD